MAKNIVVFSDGTGQDGGVRPEQHVSNVYKMYRVCKVGPESGIDPSEQVAFYDPGLGTDIGATALTAPVRFAQKMAASLSGRGITRNVADCYRFIVDHYEPGDRVFLIGFSRGAYTVRCVANLLMYCGVPTRGRDGPLLRFRGMTADIAREAVETVLEHGAGHPRAEFDAERHELARRFRVRYCSDHRDGDGKSNVEPYFIGTFDTVAALGVSGPKRTLIKAGLTAAVVIPLATTIAVTSAGVGGASYLFGGSFWKADLGAASVLIAVSAMAVLAVRRRLVAAKTKTISDWPGPGQSRSHVAEWKGENFDRLLSAQVGYARAAIAIDERRKDFDRVRWGPTAVTPPRTPGAPDQFRQFWFAGNHSDIGGSYDETESRLSDIALKWMREQAVGVPDGLKIDGMPAVADPRHPVEVMRIPRLRLHPSAAGVQHCEVAGMRDAIAARVSASWVPAWVRRWAQGKSWETKDRDIKPDATVHASVDERFALQAVVQCDGVAPYRPAPLRAHQRFATYYEGPVG
ncbi:uncharacterized protein (DUF2235 family) [Methylobacterium brachiatum]|uniref:Uncharacterized protein (DUF2235 family) n=1 Tax=Methylobacterium brachiatum TaxID=269660 RepID=A0AAJ1U359_9HYPH|nr:DUF2235 domain-containing protein [Methylobacterium brachiatum]MCB4805885.1 DUF2235 domain-containing protein [Methylobacterium brachiatum]MDQ0547158.1 uncharacterized protein (DUF2235 family) [Methylobacterium brachiatum]